MASPSTDGGDASMERKHDRSTCTSSGHRQGIRLAVSCYDGLVALCLLEDGQPTSNTRIEYLGENEWLRVSADLAAEENVWSRIMAADEDKEWKSLPHADAQFLWCKSDIPMVDGLVVAPTGDMLYAATQDGVRMLDIVDGSVVHAPTLGLQEICCSIAIGCRGPSSESIVAAMIAASPVFAAFPPGILPICAAYGVAEMLLAVVSGVRLAFFSLVTGKQVWCDSSKIWTVMSYLAFAPSLGDLYILSGQDMYVVSPTAASAHKLDWSRSLILDPRGLAVDSAGGIVVAGPSAVFCFRPEGAVVWMIRGLQEVTDLATDADGRLFIADVRHCDMERRLCIHLLLPGASTTYLFATGLRHLTNYRIATLPCSLLAHSS